MKPALVALVCTLIVSHTLGYYVPVKDYHTQPCGCSSAKLSDYEFNADSQSPAALEEPTDVKYKFDFDVEQPKATADSEVDLKSYGYAIQTPASEPQQDDIKYKFDYALQKPVEEKLEEPEQQSMYTKVDRVTQDKPECACKQGKPCSCGYSSEQCAIHCTARGSSPSPRPYNSGYVLPVRYNNGGDYVVYELPQDASTQQLRRTARQAPLEIPSLTPASEAIQNLVNNDRFRAVADRIRDRISKLTGGDGGEIKLGAPLDISALRNRFGTSDTQLGAPLDISSLRDRFSSIADATVSHATKFVENLSQRFSAPTLPTRRKREAPMTEEERREMDKRIPMLRVKEYAASREKNDDISKYTTISRVELKAGDQQEAWNKKDTYCNECGSKLTDSVCKQCGSHQPQYVEFIQGKPVSFYPGAKRPQTTTEAPRYIFDRYGHKYLENNGNLRLIAPQQYQEAIVGDQPNFAGLADILNRNQEVIQQLNPGIAPGRMIQEPVDFATGAIDLVRDLARREIKRSDKEKSERSSTVEEKNEKESERHAPRSMYQVVPMHYEGQDGKLVVKVYSSKEDKINPETQKFRYDEGITADTDSAKEYDSTNKSKPKIYKFNKNEKEFEILSFEDYKNNSNDDIRQVLEHLHGKQSW